MQHTDVVTLFISNYNSERKMHEVAKFVTPDFVYESLVQGNLTFEQFCSHVGATSFDCEFKPIEVVQKKDYVTAKMTFDMLDIQAHLHAQFEVHLRVYFRGDLACRISSTHTATPDQLVEYQKISSRYIMDSE